MGDSAERSGPPDGNVASGRGVGIGRSGAVDRPHSVADAVDGGAPGADRVRAQRLLAVLAGLGASVHAALVAKVDPSIVENVDVLVLATLDVEGSLRPAQIRDLTGLSSGGVTKLLDRLEQHGFVARRYGNVPGDRRGSQVVLTAEGRDVAGRLAEGLASRMDIVHEAIAELRSLAED